VQVRGLVKQQIDSFNFFVERAMRDIVMADGNRRLTCDADPDWFLQYTAVRVGRPMASVNYVDKPLSPHECRLRDSTYSAPVTVCFSSGHLAISGCIASARHSQRASASCVTC
jgi:DNA-directed RNA polymerase III subunit RPC2